jgi:hypothetical protein
MVRNRREVANLLNQKRSTAFKGATGDSPSPADYPVGSVESRASARFLAERKGRPTHPPSAVVEFSDPEKYRHIVELIERHRRSRPSQVSRPGEPYFEIKLRPQDDAKK